MQIKLKEKIDVFTLEHYRSQSKVTIESVDNGALVTLIADDNSTAEITFSSFEETFDLSRALDFSRTNVKQNRGWADGHSVFSTRRNTFGEPFDECIELTVTLADPERPWDELSVSASISFDSVNLLIKQIQKKAMGERVTCLLSK